MGNADTVVPRRNLSTTMSRIFILNVNFIPVDVGYQKLFILNAVNVWPSRRH